ncbi:MAG TPA: hypothetical protein VF669_22375 [Tepidisphaeraceae bacterium]|jgi:hypothetical protein
MQDPTDALSKTGRTILNINPAAYRTLVPTTSGLIQARDILESTQPQDLLASPIRNRDESNGILAALWLYHDFLDESHTIAQGIDTPTGAFWHAIMHRREGDFSNSKYWYARCANHPVLKTIAAHAADLVNQFPADKQLLKIVMTGWNPSAFVDLVEEVHRNPKDPRHDLAVRLQRLEWGTLFQSCTRAAVHDL